MKPSNLTKIGQGAVNKRYNVTIRFEKNQDIRLIAPDKASAGAEAERIFKAYIHPDDAQIINIHVEEASNELEG